MAVDEEKARREAVTRVLAGEPAGKVAADLGKSERWVRKSVARYDPSDPSWAEELSRAPRTSPNKTSKEIERLVLEVRARLMEDPWSQVGAAAIAWELEKLGLDPPESWTIERFLKRAGVPKRRARVLYVPKGTPYPASRSLPQPNTRQEIDLVGPRHLAGAVPFYGLNAVDVGRRRAAIEIIPSKQEWEIARALVRIWDRLGLPKLAQFDNAIPIQGRGRALALPTWTCLDLGVRVRFIPFAEPWRNPVIERFNDVFDKHFFRTERFADMKHLKARARRFEDFHNTHHRYSVLRKATPSEWEARTSFTLRFPGKGFTVPAGIPRRGHIEFIRLIRSDRLLKVLGIKIPMPEQLVHRYVTATLHVRSQRLVVVEEDGSWRKEIAFPLNF